MKITLNKSVKIKSNLYLLLFFIPLISFAVERPYILSLKANYTLDDNVFRENKSGDSDKIFEVSPNFVYYKALGKHKLSIGYRGKYANYDKYSKENYTDHFLNADLFLDLSRKLNVDLKTAFSNNHESRGSSGVTPSKGLDITTLDKNSIFGKLIYGRTTAKAQLSLDYKIENIKYTNNSQSNRDRKDSSATAAVIYNLGHKTKVFVEAKQNTFDYLNSNRNSIEDIYYLGSSWEVANKTTGEIRLGTFRKTFSSETETNGTGSSYAGIITWSPKVYSQFTLGLNRNTQETTTTDSFITTSTASLNWKHDFNTRFTLKAGFTRGTDDYSDSIRKDQSDTITLGVDYNFRRWLMFGMGTTMVKRDSSSVGNEFESNMIMFTATLLRAK